MNNLTVYNQYRPQMKTGDPLLYKSKGQPLGWMIQKFTEFNHASPVVRFGPDECGVDRVWTLEAVGRGVVPAYLSEKLASYHGEVWWMPLDPKFDDRRHLILECALILKGTDYDFKSLLKNVFGYVSVNLQQLFCSEFWFVLVRYANILSGDEAPRPGDIPKYKIYDPAFSRFVKIIG